MIEKISKPDDLFAVALDEIAKATTTAKHEFHTFTLGTVHQGAPHLRTVVFRKFEREQVNILFHTDIRSIKINVPGASDLLFEEMVKLSQSQGKKAINLGLGVHAGIRRFKEKWGGVPFLPYHSVLVQREDMDLGKLANKL